MFLFVYPNRTALIVKFETLTLLKAKNFPKGTSMETIKNIEEEDIRHHMEDCALRLEHLVTLHRRSQLIERFVSKLHLLKNQDLERIVEIGEGLVETALTPTSTEKNKSPNRKTLQNHIIPTKPVLNIKA